jgi:hypothetical protein
MPSQEDSCSIFMGKTPDLAAWICSLHVVPKRWYKQKPGRWNSKECIIRGIVYTPTNDKIIINNPVPIRIAPGRNCSMTSGCYSRRIVEHAAIGNDTFSHQSKKSTLTEPWPNNINPISTELIVTQQNHQPRCRRQRKLSNHQARNKYAENHQTLLRRDMLQLKIQYR